MVASLPGVGQPGGLLAGWRGLARFWGAVVVLLAVVGGTLQVLGPSPIGPASIGPVEAPAKPVAGPAAGPIARTDPLPAPPPAGTASTEAKPSGHKLRPGRDTPGPITSPDPSMLEPVAGAAGQFLPRISIDGRAPMSAYAAGFDSSSLRPRVGLLIAGIGMSEAESLAAIKTLPGGVTLAISPYAGDISHLLEVARLNEHEYLLSVPMEPQGYPVNDPDDRSALMTSLPSAENLNRLRGILARLTGYVGVTDVLGPMRGERFAGMADQMDGVLEEVADRGLLFLDGRAGQKVLPRAWNRSADMVVDDDPLDVTVLDQRLDALTHMALDKGSAVGIVSVPRPVTVARVAAWTNTLAAKGLALAPVSALVLPPAKQDPEK
jgi:polysaccharide deacetylase 2 family uncharacterized protein YibQ